jgi:Tol biopolymer transport system component
VSPSANEVVFSRRPVGSPESRILVSRLENGQWTAPVLAPFAIDTREMEPNYSPDGQRVYFNSSRLLPGKAQAIDVMNVWIATRSDGGWTDPQYLGPPVSGVEPMFVTESNTGTIYMTGRRERGIYKASRSNGGFDSPIQLPDAINGEDWPGHPYIAPDEQYLIFDSNVDDQGTKHLFMSFQEADGQWSESEDLTEHLGFPSGGMPHVTFDGRFLFFSSNGDIYWVDARVIEELKEAQAP